MQLHLRLFEVDLFDTLVHHTEAIYRVQMCLDLCRANTNAVDFDFSQQLKRSYDQKFGVGIIQLKIVVSHPGTNIRYTTFHGRYCLVLRCYLIKSE